MKGRLYLFFLLFFVCFRIFGDGVFIVTKMGVQSYEDVKNSFIQMSFVEQINNLESKPIYLDGSNKDKEIITKLSEKKPDAIFAIGPYATKMVREVIKSVLIVSAMVYYPEIDNIQNDPNTVIINSLGSGKDMIDNLKNFRKIKKVGILHSTSLNETASLISSEIEKEGVEVEDLPYSSKDDLQKIFEGLKGKIQSIIILPDPLTQSNDIIRFIVTNCLSLDILPVTFNDSMVSSGILFASYFSTDSIGETSAKTLKEIALTKSIPKNRFINPNKTTTSLNKGTLNAMKLKLPSNIKIGVIYE